MEVNGSGAGIGLLIVYAVLAVFYLLVGWRIFAKAGKPGWAIFIPIYNLIVTLQIVNRPLWWIFLLLIPLVNVVVGIIVIADMAKSFGKGTGFTLGLIFLSFIFYPVLAFGSAEYQPISR